MKKLYNGLLVGILCVVGCRSIDDRYMEDTYTLGFIEEQRKFYDYIPNNDDEFLRTSVLFEIPLDYIFCCKKERDEKHLRAVKRD